MDHSTHKTTIYADNWRNFHRGFAQIMGFYGINSQLKRCCPSFGFESSSISLQMPKAQIRRSRYRQLFIPFAEST